MSGEPCGHLVGDRAPPPSHSSNSRFVIASVARQSRVFCFASSASVRLRSLGYPPPDQVRGPGGPWPCGHLVGDRTIPSHTLGAPSYFPTRAKSACWGQCSSPLPFTRLNPRPNSRPNSRPFAQRIRPINLRPITPSVFCPWTVCQVCQGRSNRREAPQGCASSNSEAIGQQKRPPAATRP